MQNLMRLMFLYIALKVKVIFNFTCKSVFISGHTFLKYFKFKFVRFSFKLKLLYFSA